MRKHRYTAFTLAEMMVVMLIMSIILAAMAPVMTTRNKTDNSSPWRYTPQSSSNAYFGAAQSMKALIGQVNAVADGDNGKLVINTMGTSLSHILFKSNNSVLGDLYFNDSSIVLGNRMNPALTIGGENINIGHNNWSNAVNLTGSSNITIGDASMQSLSEGRHNIGIGTTLSAVTTGDHNVAVGDNALIRTTGEGNIAIGGEANQTSNTDATIAIGLHSSATGTNSIAIGSSSDTTNSNNDATSATGASSIAIGFNSSGTAGSAMAIGNSATAEDTNAIAIGGGAGAKSSNSIAIGTSVDALGSSSVAIGSNDTGTNGDSAVAIGDSATANTNAVAIGASTTAGASAVAIGDSATADTNSIAIGGSASGYGSLAVGLTANVSSSGVGNASVAIGSASTSGNKAIAIGSGTTGAYAYGEDSIAIGYNTYAYGSNNIAIGTGACRYAQGNNKVCIGYWSGPLVNETWAKKADTSNVIFLGNANSTVVIRGNLRVGKYTFLGEDLTTSDMSDNKGGLWLKMSSKYSGGVQEGYVYTTTNEDAHLSTRTSDRRLKYVGKENTSGLDKIRQLKVFNYVYKKDTTKTPHVGVIAQDLQKVFPNAVKKGADGFLTIRMEDMFYAVINAIKELDMKYQAQEKRIDALERRIEKLEARK